MKKLNPVDWIAIALVIIGAINWGFVGIFNFDLIAAIFGDMSTITRVVYSLAGLAGLYSIYLASRVGKK